MIFYFTSVRFAAGLAIDGQFGKFHSWTFPIKRAVWSHKFFDIEFSSAFPTLDQSVSETRQVFWYFSNDQILTR